MFHVEFWIILKKKILLYFHYLATSITGFRSYIKYSHFKVFLFGRTWVSGGGNNFVLAPKSLKLRWRLIDSLKRGPSRFSQNSLPILYLRIYYLKKAKKSVNHHKAVEPPYLKNIIALQTKKTRINPAIKTETRLDSCN